MKVAVFSAQRYDRELLAEANADAGHELRFFEDRLDDSTVPLTAGCGGRSAGNPSQGDGCPS